MGVDLEVLPAGVDTVRGERVVKGGLPLVGVIDEGRVSNFEREWNTGGVEGGGALVRVFGHTDLDERAWPRS